MGLNGTLRPRPSTAWIAGANRQLVGIKILRPTLALFAGQMTAIALSPDDPQAIEAALLRAVPNINYLPR